MKKFFALSIAFYFSCMFSYAQSNKLKSEIERLIRDKKATVGVSILANNCKDTININENFHYPMQSVFKFPIALVVLSEIDRGNFRLDQNIKISPEELLPDTWSPIRKKYPDGTTISLAEIIRYTIAESDNNGCDILLQLIGGTAAVEKFLSGHQIIDISVKVNEREMHQRRELQFHNWATPVALTQLLMKFYGPNDKSILSKESFDFLWKVMSHTATGTNRLKGQLPKGTVIAHKTGTSGPDKNTSAAIHDIGIIILPTGEPVFISVLISDSLEDFHTNEKIISDISKIVWKHYTK